MLGQVPFFAEGAFTRDVVQELMREQVTPQMRVPAAQPDEVGLGGVIDKIRIQLCQDGAGVSRSLVTENFRHLAMAWLALLLCQAK